ncbi:type VI secretion system protein [Pinirhizobacter sp.]|jgi:type VI secretion system protein ImpL|uniref:type VI secretion system protein n=1 Tax=Pinirhizobacter sp. TaxID=2950432 RepID=UPI002F3E6B36
MTPPAAPASASTSSISGGGVDPLFLALAVLAAVAFVLIAWLMWRARSKALAVRPARNADRQGRWVRFRDGVRRRYAVIEHAVRYVWARRDWRYRSSWLLLMGFPGDGKSSLAASVPEELQRAARQRQTSQETYLSRAVPNSQWLFLEKGILIDPDSVLGEPRNAVTSASDARWGEMLADIDSLRPDRALDGIVWVISAERLCACTTEQRADMGRHAYARIHDVQEAFAYALPVYVVFSHCDTVPGFDGFWRTQDTRLRSQIVGWSSSTLDDNGLPAEWVPKAFDKVIDGLRSLVLEAATRKDHIDDVDDFFLFPQHMRSLQAPALDFLATLFKTNVYETRSFCRGLYFTGVVGANDLPDVSGPRKDVSFVEEFIRDKAMAEQHLAQRTQKGLLARNRLIRRLQLGLVGIAVVLVVALPWSAARVNEHAQGLRDTLINISLNSKTLAQHGCLDQERIYKLIAQITLLSESTRYTAIPLSWVDRRIQGGVTGVVSKNALQQVILPAMACKLTQRIEALSATALKLSENAAAPDAVYADYQKQLKNQLSELSALEDNLQRFARIAQTGMVARRGVLVNFGALSEYLFGSPLPADTVKRDSPLGDALVEATYADVPAVSPEMRERLGQQFERMAAQAESDLLRRAAAGVPLLASLQEGKPPLLGNLRSFNSWLGWVHSRWLLSTPEDNPCGRMGDELAPGINDLIEHHRYDPNLHNTLDYFDQENCYQPAVDSLRSATLAPYGALFVINPSNHRLEGISPGLGREVGGLHDLASTTFMQVKSPLPYSCNGAAGGWQPNTFDGVLAQLREYQEFASRERLGQVGATGDQPLYERLARIQLRLALQDSLARNQRSQVQVVDTGLDASSQLDRELSDESSSLSAAVDPLLRSQQRMRQLGFGSLADEIGQCAQNYASSMLLDASSLASSSHLYNPPPASGDDDTAPLFDLGTVPVLQGYLDRQLQRVQVLSRYAAPFVTLLRQVQGINNSQRINSQVDAYWGGTISELNRAVQFADPAGQVAQLNDFFLKQLSSLSYANCEATLAAYSPPPVGNDLFSARRDEMEKLARAACSGRGQASSDLHYARIGMLFNNQLAGRYPFGPTDSREVSPAVVKAFFVYYGKEKPELKAWLEHATGPRAAKMKAFLDQLDAVEAFFAGNLSAQPQSLPVQVKVGFRALPDHSPISNQLIGWTLRAGGAQGAAWPGADDDFAWSVGTPLSLDLQWADRSRYMPLPDAAQPDLHSSGYHAIFDTGGSWALLRWLDARGTPADANALDAGQRLLRFRVPVLDGNDASGGGKATDQADLYLTLKLSGTDPATKAPVSLEAPTFPREAPVLW